MLFESRKIREDAIPSFVEEFMSENGMTITPKGISMLTEVCQFRYEAPLFT